MKASKKSRPSARSSSPSQDSLGRSSPAAPITSAVRRRKGADAPSPPLTPAEQARVDEIFVRFETLRPEPRGELMASNPYTLTVSVVLSAQATDKSVNKATEPLFRLADTPQAMLDLGEERLIEHIRAIGLYRMKAKNVMALSRILVEQHNGQVPLQREALQTLPGVGRKTASVVLNELRIEPAIAVDTHVFRVSHRLALSEAPTPEGVERDLMARTPEPYRTRAHHWLILHGRYICIARRPRCEACPLADLCPSRPLYAGAGALELPAN